jgi:hypothetical protein
MAIAGLFLTRTLFRWMLERRTKLRLCKIEQSYRRLRKSDERRGVVPFFRLYPLSLYRVDGIAYTHAKKGPPPNLCELRFSSARA